MASASTALVPPLPSAAGALSVAVSVAVCPVAVCPVAVCPVAVCPVAVYPVAVCPVSTVFSTAGAPAAVVVAVAARPADGAPPAAGVLAADLVPLLVVTMSFSRVRSVQCHTTR